VRRNTVKREKGKITKPGVRNVIESFDYRGVKLKDSMWKDQFDTMMEYYLNIPNDNILKGFRERAGRSAPGKDLGGWYTGNACVLLLSPNAKKPTGVFNTFGQWLGAFARMYKVSDDSMVLEKLRFLLNEWGKTIEKDGYFFYGANPNALHYEFEKTVGGLVDIYEYTDEKESLEYLRRITDWGLNNLNRRRINPTPDCFTGEAEYGDWIEKLFYNGIGAALPMGQDGKTLYYCDYGLTADKRSTSGTSEPAALAPIRLR